MKRMKYFDNNTYAVNPLHLTLSKAKLDYLLPELTSKRKLVWRLSRRLRGKPNLLDVLAEHIYFSDSQPAIVIQADPLLVAAYSVDLDSVAILRFSASLARKYQLGPGSKLVTINTYLREQGYQPDIIPGPRREFNWTSFHPVVADFVGRHAANRREKSKHRSSYMGVCVQTRK